MNEGNETFANFFFSENGNLFFEIFTFESEQHHEEHRELECQED